MIENRIDLQLDKTLTRLVGNSYGSTVFEKQILPKLMLNSNTKNVIVFPDNVRGVAISFVEGLLGAIPNSISRNEFYKYFSIEGSERVVDKFREVVLMR